MWAKRSERNFLSACCDTRAMIQFASTMNILLARYATSIITHGRTRPGISLPPMNLSIATPIRYGPLSPIIEDNMMKPTTRLIDGANGFRYITSRTIA